MSRIRSRSRPGKSSARSWRSEEHTSELQSRLHLVCRLLLEKKKKMTLTVVPTIASALTSRTTSTDESPTPLPRYWLWKVIFTYRTERSSGVLQTHTYYTHLH